MDIQRPSNARAKKIRRIIYASVAVVLLAGVTYGSWRLRPAAPTVDRATIWTDEVKRGGMLREVRGPGTLVPEDIRWIPAQTLSRVDRIVIHPGAIVEPSSIILMGLVFAGFALVAYCRRAKISTSERTAVS